MEIVVTNCAALNGGDAAILYAILEQLRSEFGADVGLTIFDAAAEVAKQHYPELPLKKQMFFQQRAEKHTIDRFLPGRVRWLRPLAGAAASRAGLMGLRRTLLTDKESDVLDSLERADLVVSTGGTYIVPNYDVRPKVLEFWLTRVLGKRLVLYTQSIGKFEEGLSRWMLRSALSEALLVLCRDERSKDNVALLGVDAERAQVFPDVVFSLADAETLKKAKKRTFGARPRIAVSVREWAKFSGRDAKDGMRRYSDAIQRAVVHLVERYDADVVFLSTCQGIPSYRYDDSAVATEIAAQLPKHIADRVTVDREQHGPEAMIEMLSKMDLVIATRMHMAITGLIAGTPVLPIAYEFKTAELFTSFGFGAWVQDISTIDEKGLVAALDKAIAELPTRRTELFEAVEKAASDAKLAVRGIAQRLLQASRENQG
jgi:colanic acid/amylovoran biosynthesis protein